LGINIYLYGHSFKLQQPGWIQKIKQGRYGGNFIDATAIRMAKNNTLILNCHFFKKFFWSVVYLSVVCNYIRHSLQNGIQKK
jgi:hypothetical protein